MSKQSINEFSEYLGVRIVSLKKSMEELAVDIVKDPAHALSWMGHQTFVQAATIRVFSDVIALIECGHEGGHSVERIAEEVTKRIIDRLSWGARHPEHSTSPTSNMLHLATTQVWAQLAEDISEGFEG